MLDGEEREREGGIRGERKKRERDRESREGKEKYEKGVCMCATYMPIYIQQHYIKPALILHYTPYTRICIHTLVLYRPPWDVWTAAQPPVGAVPV